MRSFEEARDLLLADLDGHAALGGSFTPEAAQIDLLENGQGALILIEMTDGFCACRYFDFSVALTEGQFDGRRDDWMAALFASSSVRAK